MRRASARPANSRALPRSKEARRFLVALVLAIALCAVAAGVWSHRCWAAGGSLEVVTMDTPTGQKSRVECIQVYHNGAD